ncbi:hypothetical protein [Haloarcula laminariae]|nr:MULTISPECIES: hypothetical protein [Halomicroarcula]
MSHEQPEADWTARHARTRPTERAGSVVRVESATDDWARRHSETDR